VAFIKTITPEEAEGKLAQLYRRVSGPQGQVDKVLQVHSLRPHSMEGHMALYKAVLHHSGNKLAVWFLESIGVLVSRLNGCEYCEQHHSSGMRNLLADQATKFARCLEQLCTDSPGDPFTAAESAALRYARKLTQTPGDICQSDIDQLRAAGLSDGEILEINQVASYFSYANRTVSGLGVTTSGEVLGLSPGDENSWQHG